MSSAVWMSSPLSVLDRIAPPGKSWAYCWISSAAVPVALGVAMLVPLYVP